MYIEQGYKGRFEPWLYILGFVFVFISWQFVGSIPLITVLLSESVSFSTIARSDMRAMMDVLGLNTFLFFVLLSFAIGILCLFAWTSFVHKQPIRNLTTSREKVDWRRILFAFNTWVIILVVFTVINLELSPEDYVFNFNLLPFLVLALISIIMIPIQTSMEEYFIRGYMMQGIGIMAKNRWVPLIITSVLFGLLHSLNPEVSELGCGIMFYYIGTGLFLGIVTLMDKGLELALGFHAANNLTLALLVTTDWNSLQTHALYKDVSNPVLGWDFLITVFVIYPILLLLFSKKYDWKNWKEHLTGEVISQELFVKKTNL